MRVVLANGCFDPAHYGHLLHLKAAREMGDYLIVSVTSDESVRKEKPGRPIFTESQRAEFVESLKCVDHAIIVPSVLLALATVRPDILVKGPDYRQSMGKDVREYCKRHGIAICFTHDKKWSSTDLIRELRRG